MPSQAGDCFYTRLLKVDAELGTSQEWKEVGTFPGEPIFVPHPEASKEDQGVLLSVVLAGNPVTKRLVSTACKSMQELLPIRSSCHAAILLNTFNGLHSYTNKMEFPTYGVGNSIS